MTSKPFIYTGLALLVLGTGYFLYKKLGKKKEQSDPGDTRLPFQIKYDEDKEKFIKRLPSDKSKLIDLLIYYKGLDYTTNNRSLYDREYPTIPLLKQAIIEMACRNYYSILDCTSMKSCKLTTYDPTIATSNFSGKLNLVAGEPVHCSKQIPNAGDTCTSQDKGNTFVWKRLNNGNIELTSFNTQTGVPQGNPAIIQTHFNFRNFSGLRIA